MSSERQKMRAGEMYDPVSWLPQECVRGAIILAGVRIGSRAVIGAGSVVTRDVPEDVFAAGNPCRVIRQIVE